MGLSLLRRGRHGRGPQRVATSLERLISASQRRARRRRGALSAVGRGGPLWYQGLPDAAATVVGAAKGQDRPQGTRKPLQFDGRPGVRADIRASSGTRPGTSSRCRLPSHLTKTASQAPRVSMNITQSSGPSQRAACFILLIEATKEPGAKRCSFPSTVRMRVPVTVVQKWSAE